MGKKDRLINKYLQELHELKQNLPKKYHPYEDVTQIHYGFMGRKTITVDDIKNHDFTPIN